LNNVSTVLGEEQKRQTLLAPSRRDLNALCIWIWNERQGWARNPGGEAHHRSYVATSLLRAIEVSDQESRIVAIEENQRRIERSLLPPVATGGSQPNGE
jgi:hypothetical protein